MKPAHSPQEAPGLASLDLGPLRLCGGALRHLAARALLCSSSALRRSANSLTRLRWKLEDGDTPRNRAVQAGHPSALPRLVLLDTYQPTTATPTDLGDLW